MIHRFEGRRFGAFQASTLSLSDGSNWSLCFSDPLCPRSFVNLHSPATSTGWIDDRVAGQGSSTDAVESELVKLQDRIHLSACLEKTTEEFRRVLLVQQQPVYDAMHLMSNFNRYSAQCRQGHICTSMYVHMQTDGKDGGSLTHTRL